MNDLKETPREYAERIAGIFGIREPVGVRLRGDSKGIFYNGYEILLVDNFKRCRSLYRQKEIQDSPTVQEHLKRQERALYRLALGFDIDIEPHLGDGGTYYEFIPWPDKAESYYTLGLADKIMVTDMNELPYLLDFQFFNHVRAEKFNGVKFLQMLKYFVRHHLSSELPIVDDTKLRFLDDWIYRHVLQLNDDGKRAFFWYEKAFDWKETDVESQNVVEQKDEEEQVRPDGSQAPDEIIPSSDANAELATFRTLCSDDELVAYFNLLKQQNPKDNRPFLNAEAVEWLVGYFFGDRHKHSLSSRPKFKVNMSKKEVMFFVYQYSTVVSPGGKSDESSPLKETLKILTIGFSEMFSKSEAGYYKTISSRVKDVNKGVMDLLKGKPAQRSLYR